MIVDNDADNIYICYPSHDIAQNSPQLNHKKCPLLNCLIYKPGHIRLQKSIQHLLFQCVVFLNLNQIDMIFVRCRFFPMQCRDGRNTVQNTSKQAVSKNHNDPCLLLFSFGIIGLNSDDNKTLPISLFRPQAPGQYIEKLFYVKKIRVNSRNFKMEENETQIVIHDVSSSNVDHAPGKHKK